MTRRLALILLAASLFGCAHLRPQPLGYQVAIVPDICNDTECNVGKRPDGKSTHTP